MYPGLALSSAPIGSNYPCLELILMVPMVFEPLKFDCSLHFDKHQKNEIYSLNKLTAPTIIVGVSGVICYISCFEIVVYSMEAV